MTVTQRDKNALAFCLFLFAVIVWASELPRPHDRVIVALPQPESDVERALKERQRRLKAG